MISIISGQRRRLIYFALTMALGLWLIGLLPGVRWYSELISLLVAPVFLSAIAIAVFAYVPAKRGWLECIGTGVLIGAAIGELSPLDGLVGLPLAVFLSIGLVMALHEDWAELIDVTFPLYSSASGTIRADGAGLWDATVPGGGHLVSARLVDLETDAAAPKDIFHGGLMACGELAEEVTLTVLERSSAGFARLHIKGEDMHNRPSSSWLSITITEKDPESSRLTLREIRESMRPGEVIERWFDDVLGCEVRHLQAHFLHQNPSEPEVQKGVKKRFLKATRPPALETTAPRQSEDHATSA